MGGGSMPRRSQPCCPRLARTTSAVANATEVSAEKTISAAASRACSRTRRGAGGVSVAVGASIDPSMTGAMVRGRWCGFAGPGLRPLRCRLGPGKVSQKAAVKAPPVVGSRLAPGKVRQESRVPERAETSPCDPPLELCCVVLLLVRSWAAVLVEVGEVLLGRGVVVAPARRLPDLDAVHRADHDHVAADGGVLAQRHRDRDPALLVGHDLLGAREEHADLVTPAARGHALGAGAVGLLHEHVGREDVEALLLPLCHHEPLRQSVPELGRKDQPPLVVELGGVGAHEEHRAPPRFLLDPPLSPHYSTSLHRQPHRATTPPPGVRSPLDARRSVNRCRTVIVEVAWASRSNA